MAGPKTFKLNICAVMSVPRIGWNDAWGPLYDVLSRSGMPLKVFMGGSWHAELENTLDWCLGHGFENVLTLDYDSLFTHWHLMRLLTLFNRHQEFDAIAPFQCRRHDRKALFWINDAPDKIEITMNRPFAVDCAHFGMTAIRLNRLKDIPKPWFMPAPAPDGSWDREHCLDADTSFWKKWREHGRTIGVCGDVRIGHLEVMTSYYDDKLQPAWSTVVDWNRMHDENRIPGDPDSEKPWIVVGPGTDWYLPEKAPKTLIFFEPRAEACEVLRRNYPYAEVIEAAVSTEDGERNLHCYNEGMSSSLEEMTDEARSEFEEDFPLEGVRTVKTVQLSRFCRERGYDSLGFLSLDAQGMDLSILNDMAPWLESRSIQYVEHEVDVGGFRHYEHVENQKSDATRLMERCGYRLKRAKPPGAVQQDLFWCAH